MTYQQFLERWGAPLNTVELTAVRFGYRTVTEPDPAVCLALRNVMQTISDTCYAGRWPQEFSHQLYDIVQHGPAPVGNGYVTKVQVARLRELWRDCDGWWDRVNGGRPDIRFYPRDAWVVRVREGVICR